jgi:hypothetical protein
MRLDIALALIPALKWPEVKDSRHYLMACGRLAPFRTSQKSGNSIFSRKKIACLVYVRRMNWKDKQSSTLSSMSLVGPTDTLTEYVRE